MVGHCGTKGSRENIVEKLKTTKERNSKNYVSIKITSLGAIEAMWVIFIKFESKRSNCGLMW